MAKFATGDCSQEFSYVTQLFMRSFANVCNGSYQARVKRKALFMWIQKSFFFGQSQNQSNECHKPFVWLSDAMMETFNRKCVCVCVCVDLLKRSKTCTMHFMFISLLLEFFTTHRCISINVGDFYFNKQGYFNQWWRFLFQQAGGQGLQ